MTFERPAFFPNRGPRAIAMLIKIEKEDGEIAYISASEHQLAGAQVLFDQEVEYNTAGLYPGDPMPFTWPTGRSHQKITIDGLKGYTMTVRPPGNWENRPELEDPTVVEEDDNGEPSGPPAISWD